MAAPRTLLLAPALLLLTFSRVPTLLSAQATVSTGSIVGTVGDPSGAVIIGANVTITNVATGQVIELTTNSSGSFNSGALVPGSYKTFVTARRFTSAESTLTVIVGNTTAVNVKLQIGSGKEVIKVQNSSLQVNTVQPTVQGVVTEQQIEIADQRPQLPRFVAAGARGSDSGRDELR